jgi:NAD dependent epimerase/dehydratase family enzyme
VLRAPGFILRMVFGEMSDVLLASQRVAPLVAEESGYRFERDTIEDALTAALAAA